MFKNEHRYLTLIRFLQLYWILQFNTYSDKWILRISLEYLCIIYIVMYICRYVHFTLNFTISLSCSVLKRNNSSPNSELRRTDNWVSLQIFVNVRLVWWGHPLWDNLDVQTKKKSSNRNSGTIFYVCVDTKRNVHRWYCVRARIARVKLWKKSTCEVSRPEAGAWPER